MSELRRLASEELELEMTPMIDVTFLLLIFFMCTLKFKTLEGQLAAYLPNDVGSHPNVVDPSERIRIAVRVVAPGTQLDVSGRPYGDPSGHSRFEWGPDRKIEYTAGAVTTRSLDELGDHLERVAQALPEQTVVIAAGPATCYGDMVGVLDEVLSQGLMRVTFEAAPRE